MFNILKLIIPLITTPYISRVMGAENVGIYSYAYSIASYFGMFILLGLSNYGNRTIAEVKGDTKQLSRTFINIYTMQLCMGLVVLLLYILYVIFLAENKVMAIILIFYIISSILDISWFYFGLEQFKVTVTRNVIIKIINTILLFICIKSKDDIYIYALLIVLGTIINQIILWGILHKYITFEKPNFKEVLNHIKPNLILFIPVVAVSVYNTMDKIMLGIMSDMTQVGYYESSFKLTSIPVTIIGALGTVMLPRMSNLLSKGDDIKAKQYIQKSLVLSLFLSAPMSLGLCAITNEFVPLFYGYGYDPCKYIIPILVLSSLFIAWGNVIITQYLIPQKKDVYFIISVCLGAIVNVCINFILIPKYSAFGAAIGTLAAEITVCLYQSYIVKNEIDVNKIFLKGIPFTTFAILMYILLVFVPNEYGTLITLSIKVLLGGILYISLSFVYYKIYLKSHL